MYISGQNSIYANRMNEKVFGVKALKKQEKEEDLSVTEKEAEDNQNKTEDSLEISPEGRLAAEQSKVTQESSGSDTEESEEGILDAEEAEAGSSEETSGKVAVNEGKRARQIAAAQSRGQVQQVLALLRKDLADCKAGLEKGWCDESEIAKVEALINSANARMSQVPQESEEDSKGGLDAFAMASLM